MTESSPRTRRNALLADHLIASLRRRGMTAFYCPTVAEAALKVSELIPDGASVTWGGSASLREAGIPALLKSRPSLTVFDRDEAPDRSAAVEIYRKAFDCDVYLSSVNALSQDGEIVNIDGNGNRVAAITWGPQRVIFLVGLNKVAADLPSAIARARGEASPVNASRFDIQTPCRSDGVCHDCLAPDSICNYVHVLRHSPRGKHLVVLVGESLGF